MSDIHNKLKKRFIEAVGGDPITRLEIEALLKLKAYQDDLVALDQSKTNLIDTIENTNKLEDLKSLLQISKLNFKTKFATKTKERIN